MTYCDVMILGFGGVGQAFAQILNDQEKAEEGLRYRVVAISDLHQGWAYNEQGLDLALLLDKETRPMQMQSFDIDPEDQTLALIRDSKLDVMVEATYTTHDGQPAIAYFREALSNGIHIVTTNKGPVALASKELEQLAKDNSVSLMVEGTVMSGTPVITVLDNIVDTTRVTKIRGIFNGTCNYILTQMRAGMSYQEALEQAQSLGFAEADPKNDVEGWDVALKMLILSNRYMKTDFSLDDIRPKGIDQLSIEDVNNATADGKRWRLIGQIVQQEKNIIISIQPELLSEDDPLFFIDGAINAVNVECGYLGSFTVSGPGAGLLETGYALWADMNVAVTGEKG